MIDLDQYLLIIKLLKYNEPLWDEITGQEIELKKGWIKEYDAGKAPVC